MYSNLISQLKEMKALDRLQEVLEEIPRVREDLGWPPLVTPTSQIVGTQAVLNVLFGRYERVTQEVKNYIKGLYGRPPAEITPELKKKVLGDEEPITARPGELLEPMLEKCRKELEELGIEKEEDVLTYCLFPQIAKEFFEARKAGRKGPQMPPSTQRLKLYVNGVEFEVGLEGVDLSALKYLPQIASAGATASLANTISPSTSSASVVSSSVPAPAPVPATPSPTPAPAGEGVIGAPMPGKILRILVKEGEQVKTGQGLLILEAMKMENEIPAPKDGVVKRILVKEGDTVDTGQPLIELG
jgi:pyruvate carboxylase subunit B